LTIVDADTAESSFQAATINGVHGVLTIDSAGNWNYSADNTTSAIQSLHIGQTLIESLTVTTFDGTSHDIVIRINGAEDPEPPGPPAPDPDSEYTPPVDGSPQTESPESPEAGIIEEVATALENFEGEEIYTNAQIREPLALNTNPEGIDQLTDGPQYELAYAKIDTQPAAQTIQPRVFESTDVVIDSLEFQAGDDEATSERLEAMLLQQLDLMNSSLDNDLERRNAESIKVQIVMSTTTTLTAGIVSWVLRGGSLLASLMSTVPLLKRFDPLPIIKVRNDEEDVEPDDDETEITGVYGENQRRVDNMFTPDQADRQRDEYLDE
jgi:VCBS repeat-containing protein